MKELKRPKVKSSSTITRSSLYNGINKKLYVTDTLVYCNTCGKSIHDDNPILCYIFIDYFCTEKCHVQKHKIYSEKPYHSIK